MTEKKEGITAEDINEVLSSIEEDDLPAEILPASVHRRAAPSSGGSKALKVIIVLLVVFSLAGLGYYYSTNPTGEKSLTPDQSGGKEAAVATGQAELSVKSATRPSVTPDPVESVAREGEAPVPVATERVNPVKTRETSAVTEKQVSEDTASASKYVIQAGVFRSKTSLAKVEKIIRQLGFEPEVIEQKKETEMTRLLLGTFNEAEAKSFMVDIKSKVPDVFLLRDGERFSVYAASFSSSARAHRMAQSLADKGISVKEVPAKVVLGVYRVSFGAFGDEGAAREVSNLAVAAGLDTSVIERQQGSR